MASTMQSGRSSVQHARFVDDVVSGRQPARGFDIRIRDSWRRCLSSYKLSPDQGRRPTLVTASELRRRRERMDPLYSIASIEMAGLARLLNAPVGVMLTDSEGLILGYTGAADFAEVAYNSGLREGAIWSEAEQGTNGMGTCLVTREPVLIETDEHFLARNIALTCCGGPIRNGRGSIIGALNISGRLRLSAAPTLALVRLAVQNIENRLLLTRNPRHYLLRFHPHREFIATAGEGILVIDDGGHVIGANLGALDWLGLPDHHALHGKSVERLFGLDLDRLMALGADPASARPLPQRERGSLCYGILQPSLAASRPRQGALPRHGNALIDAQRQALREVLERCGWNVTLAATQLNISRRTLHRKLKAHGLKRYSAWDGKA